MPEQQTLFELHREKLHVTEQQKRNRLNPLADKPVKPAASQKECEMELVIEILQRAGSEGVHSDDLHHRVKSCRQRISDIRKHYGDKSVLCLKDPNQKGNRYYWNGS